MPPKKTTATPMSAVGIEQLIETRVAKALANQEIQRNSNPSNENGDGNHNCAHSPRVMESVFYVSNCTVENQVKFAACTLLGVALTWWNSYVKTVSHDTAYGMPWKTLMKMMTEKYCPRSEIKKLEIEIWNLKVMGTDVVSYTQHFQELALMCGRMFLEESDEVEKYVGGLPDNIKGNVMLARPKIMQEVIELVNCNTPKMGRSGIWIRGMLLQDQQHKIY
ncbi:reverse transcriptase domain-containing protein, partial [Tanacetum coccineum]